MVDSIPLYNSVRLTHALRSHEPTQAHARTPLCTLTYASIVYIFHILLFHYILAHQIHVNHESEIIFELRNNRFKVSFV